MSFVITGSVAYDYLMRFPGRFRDHILPDQLENLSLSFLADSMLKERGGIAANIAYTNKLLGGDPTILATVGQDFGDYRRWLEENDLNTDQIIEIPNEFTASFFCNTDLDGRQIASFYTGAMQRAGEYSLASRHLDDADLVIISPNDPTAMLNYAIECKQLGIRFAYDPSQQVARLSGEELIQSIPGAAYLCCNEYELAIIQDKTGWNRTQVQEQVEILILTLAEKGSVIYTDFGVGDEIHIPPADIIKFVNPTGSGDAYRGGFFAARLKGLPLDVCGRVGSLSAAYALEQVGPTVHHFTLAEFSARYAETFGPEPTLDALQ
ncbi:MAG: carbohydrate kinase family protein [Chloroflexi bacterium]|nr:carbohydrate kinase family protein [Chloroflexota bacterium]